jgi:tetratricopeptide (TPR) repeat protein
VNGDPVLRRIEFEQRKRGFKRFTSAREFLRGWDAYQAKDFRTALSAFKRLTEIEPENPYTWAYYLFAIEDAGGYSIQELADVSAKWHEAALSYKIQGQPSLSIQFFSKYIKMLEKV